jgi:hypothetical protein
MESGARRKDRSKKSTLWLVKLIVILT